MFVKSRLLLHDAAMVNCKVQAAIINGQFAVSFTMTSSDTGQVLSNNPAIGAQILPQFADLFGFLNWRFDGTMPGDRELGWVHFRNALYDNSETLDSNHIRALAELFGAGIVGMSDLRQAAIGLLSSGSTLEEVKLFFDNTVDVMNLRRKRAADAVIQKYDLTFIETEGQRAAA